MKEFLHSALSSWLVRTCMVLFWLIIIFCFLYTPTVTRLFSHKKSISLFVWPMILDAKVMEQFERETGIKVYVNYYETNEELYGKLRATGGKDYDLIVPTDYMVQTLIQDGLVKKIDTTRLSFKDQLKPYLLGHYFDPRNEYSIPYYTCIFGLGINKNYFGGVLPQASWSLVFDQAQAKFPMSMLDSAREAIMLAGFYLYGSLDRITEPEALKNITELLI
ncbi:MAG TPA: extracellular solute-binding protein, partial [Candidatus Limnocylindria bacterium]|nr:extracellular solute-binding protein [Candidatus Limnocylindria bacterium]